MNHGGGKLKSAIITVFLAVIGIQLAFAAIEPYLGWVGRTLALVIIALLLVGTAFALLPVIRYIQDRFGGGGTFNG